MMRWGFLLTFPLWAQLQPPSLGHVLDAHGHERVVLGVPGAFVLSEVARRDFLALTCSATLCVGKTETQLLARDFAAEVAGPALIAVEGERALLYFPETREFKLFAEGGLTPLAWTLSGDVVAVGMDQVAVREGARVRVLRRDGAVLRTIETEGPVELLRDAVAYAAGGEVAISRDSGEEIRFALTEVKGFFRPSSEYLGVRTLYGTFLIRLARGREEMWQLPEAAE